MPVDPSSPPMRVVLEQSGLSRWSGRLGWTIAFIAIAVAMVSAGANAQYFQTSAKLVETWHSLSKIASDKVAILEVKGAILGGDGFARSQIDQIDQDESVKAIVLRIDSPGGTVSGSDELHFRLKELARKRKLPVVVSMGGIAASGGYYLAMAAGDRENVLFAEPATLTGSIGVIIPHFDFSKLLDRFDIKDDSITSGPLKDMLSPTKARPPELAERERKVVQQLVDEMFVRFREIVKAGRPALDEETLNRATTGQIFTAQQAKDLGLIDTIGFLEDAVTRAVDLAGLTPETARVVRYSRPKGLLDELLGGDMAARAASARSPFGESAAGSAAAMLAELSAPRAWYLCTWLPAVVANQ